MELDQRQTLILAILVLFLGRWLNRHCRPLREWNIPEPVTGGLIASVAFGIAHFAFHTSVGFTMDARDMLLIVFFTTIGLSANVRMLAAGGVVLVILTVVAACNNVIQDLVGVACRAASRRSGGPRVARRIGGARRRSRHGHRVGADDRARVERPRRGRDRHRCRDVRPGRRRRARRPARALPDSPASAGAGGARSDERRLDVRRRTGPEARRDRHPERDPGRSRSRPVSACA
jgi:hypothetical protein